MKRLRRLFCWHRWSKPFGFIPEAIQQCERCGCYRDTPRKKQ